ncbi:HAMP domain-containing sensor histidine kinase [Hyphomonas sp. FCG-A18]|uniref:sensor histidine kinase n=1 Tax=Hyphomonas sp. FCG-A18 TaxID=3080019 RepID=UPI002B287C05|nr:HAMP domain-containing sensor histidine kinase [Hyphomonas sp. FCG-A18]
MANKSHRSVNELTFEADDPAFFSVLIQGGLAALLVGLVMLAGGLASPAIALVVLFPILIGLTAGLRAVRSAILYAVAAFTLLGLMHVLALMPPPIAFFREVSNWVLAAAITLAILLFLRRDRLWGGEVALARPSQEGAKVIQPNHMPALLVDVSEYGRIRALHGDESMLPGVRTGQEVTALLVRNERRPTLDLSHEKGRLLIFTSTEAVDDETSLQDIAGLGHDLKSPLNAILGFSGLMEGDTKALPSAFKDYPGFISEAGQVLLSRVEQLLDLIKADSGNLSLNMRPVNVYDLARDSLARLSGVAKATSVGFRLSGDETCQAFADPEAMARIIENLVTNAIKYAEAGDTISLRVEMEPRWARLTVQDRGTGIGAEDLEKLAQPYVQASHTDGREGTGLGLALVKKLVAMQNGEFRIRSARGHGTEMIIRLPLAASD